MVARFAGHEGAGVCRPGSKSRSDPIPPDLADHIPEGTVVRVILLVDAGEDASWRQLSLDRFSAAYSEEDAVYQKLDNGPVLR
jgi:hypothetical protein